MKNEFSQTIFWHHYEMLEVMMNKNRVPFLFWLRSFFLSDKAEKPFQRYYLKNSTIISIKVLSIVLFMLLISIYIITQKYFWHFDSFLDPTFDHYFPALVNISIWAVLSVLCLSYFLILRFNPKIFRSFPFTDECDVWYELGCAILLVRFLVLIHHVHAIMKSSSSCVEMDEIGAAGSQDDTFGYLFLKATTDAYMAYAFVSLPFPQPWATGFVVVECLHQVIRMRSCSQRLVPNPDHAWLANLTVYLAVIMYVTVLLAPAMYLEASFRNRYDGDQQRCADKQSKRQLLNFLSTEVRVPLQYMFHTINNLEPAALAHGEGPRMLKTIQIHSTAINDIANDLLLLVRINENRYTSKYSRIRDLWALIDAMLQSVKQDKRHQQYESSIIDDSFLYILHAPSISVMVDIKCLCMTLRLVLLFLIQNRITEECENQRTLAVNVEINTSDNTTTSIQRLSICIEEYNRDVSVILSTMAAKQDTMAFTCRAISIACGGEFLIDKKQKYTIIFPCCIVEIPDPNPYKDDSNTKLQALLQKSTLLQQKIRDSREMQARFRKNAGRIVLFSGTAAPVTTASAEQSPTRPAPGHEQRRIARKQQMQRIRTVLTGTAAPPSSPSVKEPQGEPARPSPFTTTVWQLSNPQFWRRHCRSYLSSAYHQRMMLP